MIDFKKLETMVNEVNNIIDDINKEQKDIETKIDNNYKKAFFIVLEDFKKYNDLIYKSLNNSRKTYEYNIKLKNMYISFEREYNAVYRDYIVIKYQYDKYHIRINDYRTNEEIYNSLNKSHKAIKEFLNTVLEWEKFKPEFETKLANIINSIIENRVKLAHKNYDKVVNTANNFGIEI